MERLTFMDNGKPAHRFKNCVYKNEIAQKLYAYEDTGLTPEEVEALKAFKVYFDDMYGKGLEVANWHMNGSLEPFDNFYESAISSRKENNNAKLV